MIETLILGVMLGVPQASPPPDVKCGPNTRFENGRCIPYKGDDPTFQPVPNGGWVMHCKVGFAPVREVPAPTCWPKIMILPEKPSAGHYVCIPIPRKNSPSPYQACTNEGK